MRILFQNTLLILFQKVRILFQNTLLILCQICKFGCKGWFASNEDFVSEHPVDFVSGSKDFCFRIPCWFCVRFVCKWWFAPSTIAWLHVENNVKCHSRASAYQQPLHGLSLGTAGMQVKSHCAGKEKSAVSWLNRKSKWHFKTESFKTIFIALSLE